MGSLYIFSISDVEIVDNLIWYKIETKQGAGYIQEGFDIILLRVLQNEKDLNYGNSRVINDFINSGTKYGIGLFITGITLLIAGYFLFRTLLILSILFFITGINAIFIDQYRKKHY